MNFRVRNRPIFKRTASNTAEYLPHYVFETHEYTLNFLTYYYYRSLLFIIKFIIKLRLRILDSAYKNYIKDEYLSNEEVARIYEREARFYEKKHHLTTNFRDTWWRRQVALDIIDYIRINGKHTERIAVMDVATGTGLSVEEMLNIFKLYDVAVSITAMDYNEKMLEVAHTVILPRIKAAHLINEKRSVTFLRSDARNLLGKPKGGLTTFSQKSFDCVSIMFGIGGIDYPVFFLRDFLLILKPGCIISMHDIHRPYVFLNEHWPFFIGSKNAAAFTTLAWEQITTPLVLQSLWGWRDVSKLFYLLQLITVRDVKNQKFYGFTSLSFFMDTESWWFNLPVISTAKIVVEKIELTEEEASRRSNLLSFLLA